MKNKTVLLISDLHTNYHVINAQILHAEEAHGGPVSQVMVLGDFGFFGDQLNSYFRNANKRFLRPVSFIEGNHEDHAALQELAGRFADVVTYLPRGCVEELGPWRGLCLGGARYMDSWSTPRGCEITDADVDACMEQDPEAVDMVLSHDCPADIEIPNTPGLEHYGRTGVPQMDRLAKYFRPRWWFFGHHHRWFDLSREGTRYIGLPQSWLGYVLLDPDGDIEMVKHEVPIESRPQWKRWFGLR